MSELLNTIDLASLSKSNVERVRKALWDNLTPELALQVTSEQISRMKSQKSGLMHDLLTGKVHVKIENSEVVDG